MMTKQDKAFLKGSNIQEHVVKEVWKDGKMTEIAAIGKIDGPSAKEMKRVLKLLVDIDNYLRRNKLSITKSLIYTEDEKIKVNLEITEIKG
jgi:hypothetical protein